VADRISPLRSRGELFPVPNGFGLHARNTLDRVTATVPKLLYDRLDEIGLDFAVLYPTLGLSVDRRDPEERQVLARSLNIYNAEVFAPYRDRIEPVAAIPMVTPDEAVAELRHAVGELGLKTVVMNGAIPRTVRPDGVEAPWIDSLGHGSLYNYDPV